MLQDDLWVLKLVVLGLYLVAPSRPRRPRTVASRQIFRLDSVRVDSTCIREGEKWTRTLIFQLQKKGCFCYIGSLLPIGSISRWRI